MSKHRHIVIEVPDTDYSAVNQYPDSYLASIRVAPVEPIESGNPEPGKFGRIPFLDLSAPRDRSGDVGEPGLPYGGFVTWALRNQVFTNNPDNLYTRISKNNLAAGNISVASHVTISGSGFFRRNVGGVNKTAIRVGVDLLQVVRASGKIELYTIASLIDATNVQVNHYESGVVASFDSSEELLITWIQPVFRAGAETFEYRARPILGETSDGHRPMPGFFAGSLHRANSFPIGEKENVAFRWGGFNERDATTETSGALYADGWIDCRVISGSLSSASTGRFISSGSGSFEYNLFPSYDVAATPANVVLLVTGGPCTYNFTFSDSHLPRPGQRITIIIEINGTHDCTINFVDNTTTKLYWKFSGSDDVLPPLQAGTYKFEGVVMASSSFTYQYQMLMTRTDY